MLFKRRDFTIIIAKRASILKVEGKRKEERKVEEGKRAQKVGPLLPNPHTPLTLTNLLTPGRANL
jgi:hypothetical protein